MNRMLIRQAARVHLAGLILVSFISWAIGTPQHALNCAFSSLLIGLNLAIVAWSLGKIFQKKSIALAVGVIVIKYSALLGLFLLLHFSGWRMDFGFVLGLSTLFPTVGFIAYKYIRHSEIDDSL